MKRQSVIGAGVLSVAVCAAAWAALRSPEVRAAGGAPSDCFPSHDEPFYIASLLAIDGPGLTESPMLYLGRATLNRLRTEAGAAAGCDREGLVLEVVAGEGASRWGIPAGTTLQLTQVRDGVPIPAKVMAGEDWFLAGKKVLFSPCDHAQAGKPAQP